MGPNSSKPIFPSWEQVQSNIQPVFNVCAKFFGGPQGFNQKIALGSVSLSQAMNIGSLGFVKSDKKIAGILSGKGQGKG